TSHEDLLADVHLHILTRGAAALHGDDGNGLERPRFRSARGALHIDMKISMRILPFDTGKRAVKVLALGGVEFSGEGMMAVRRNGGQESDSRQGQCVELKSVHSICLPRKNT